MKERDKVTAAFMIKTFIENRFSEIEGFRDFLSSAIAREKNLIEERVAKQRQNMSDEELEIYLRVEKTYSIAKYVFPEMGIKSFILILHSFIETGMNHLCRAGQIDQDSNLSVRDMKGTGIDRAKLYLKKVVGLDLHVEDKPWREIKALNKIRNTLVHYDGFIDRNFINDGTIKSCIEKGFLEIGSTHDNANDKIIIKFEYLDWIIAQAREFFKNIEI